MDPSMFERKSEYEYWIPKSGTMRVPGIIFATDALIRGMDRKVYEQVANVASLPGIVKASYAMPDAHWGYGFPIEGVLVLSPSYRGVAEEAPGAYKDVNAVVDAAQGATLSRKVGKLRPIACVKG